MPMHQHPRGPLWLALALLSLALVSCGDEARGGEDGASASSPEVLQSAVARDESEEARALRRALDLGLLQEATASMETIDIEPLGVEWELMQARYASLCARDLDVTRFIEAARAADAEDPRVYGTAAELHAASGRLETAREELRRGLETCGMGPELLRAQGVIELCRQGRADKGLALLDRALTYDASLPYTLRARAQGHLLLAKAAFAEQRNKAALERVRLSLELDSGDADARLFFVDALAANGEFPSAVHVLQELVSAGMQRETELALMYKRAAIGELVLRNRSAALEYFRLGREAGLTDEELGSGVDMLREAALTSMKDGSAAFADGDLDAARTHFEHALGYDSSLLVLHSQLAVVLFQQKQFLPAATHWREVLDAAIAEDLVLPDPTHIFLAKALYAAGEKRAAKSVLVAYLEREPNGEWAEATGSLLSELE